MTPEERQTQIDILKKQGQAAVEQADKLMAELAVKSSRLKTDVMKLRDTLSEELTSRSTD